MNDKNKIIVKKNQSYVVDIIDYGSNGEGIAKIDGYTIFVPFALIGERIEILIVQAKKDYAFGKILNIINKSSTRVIAPCPYFTKCGGCQLQHMQYNQQLKYKTGVVHNCISKYSKLIVNVNECLPSDKIYGYRNKFSFPVEEIDGKVIVGMYRIASHTIVPIDNCLIQEDCKKIIECFVEFANQNNIKAYNSQTKQGVKHIVCRIFNDSILLSIVSTQNLRKMQILAQKLQKYYNNVNISVNINTKDNNVIMGEKNYLCFGEDHLKITEFGLTYPINNNSFMQVNNNVKHKLYDTVLNNISNQDIVVDAYSGAGVLSAIMAQKCKHVYGIEIVKPAVDSANKLAQQNNINNLTNICGDCATELPKLVSYLENFIVVLDPPRKGCDKRVIDVLNKTLPNKIIYISCNPATLARDLSLMAENYTISNISPFDMFPQTTNVETLVILNKK